MLWCVFVFDFNGFSVLITLKYKVKDIRAKTIFDKIFATVYDYKILWWAKEIDLNCLCCKCYYYKILKRYRGVESCGQ